MGSTKGALKEPPISHISIWVGSWREGDPQTLHFAVEGAVGGEVEAGVGAGAGDAALPLRHIHHPHCWMLEAAARMGGCSANGLANSAK